MIPVPIPEFKVMDSKKRLKAEKMASVSGMLDGKIVKTADIVKVLENVIRPNETVALEGDNQKQAVELSRALTQVDPAKVNGLLMAQICQRNVCGSADLIFYIPDGLSMSCKIEISVAHNNPPLL